MDIELKPCPVCGGKATLEKYVITKGGRLVLGWHVECTQCGCGENNGRGNIDKDKAIMNWNSKHAKTL